MTKLLDQAIETARALPPDIQDEAARLLLLFLGADQPVYEMTEAEARSLDKSLAQAARREFVPDDQVRALWAKHDL